MAHYQNQYGAVPASDNPIQKKMDTAGDIAGVGSTEQLAGADAVTGPGMIKTTTTDATPTTTTPTEEHHYRKKGIMEKIKEKLRGKHHHEKQPRLEFIVRLMLIINVKRQPWLLSLFLRMEVYFEG